MGLLRSGTLGKQKVLHMYITAYHCYLHQTA
nr:MAG TPA: hypothetical protein [Caudoviricetes sp.]